jgi:AhpD family alkylhydroperoxidase
MGMVRNSRNGWVTLGIAMILVAVVSSGALAQGGASKSGMSPVREKVYGEIEAAFGFVPGFVKTIPDASLQQEWDTLRAVQMAPGAIPGKYRELIGLAVAASRGCEYCAYFHTEFAKLNGATDAEIEDAVHFAKSNAGWSTYLHGMQYDLDQFRSDVDRICQHARSMQSASASK